MAEYIQSVVVEGKVYVGGGYSGKDSDYNYIVMEYYPHSDKWNELPPYRYLDFTMTVINNQLAIIGGYNYIESYKDGHTSKVIGVWNTKWTHPYPEMPRGRSHCSAVVYKEWLVLAGGVEKDLSQPNKFKILTSVDVFNTSTMQWYVGPPMPIPWFSTKTAVVNDTGYFIGGYTSKDGLATFSTDSSINSAYSVPIPDLITASVSMKQNMKKKARLWKEIVGLPAIGTDPLSISGSLLIVGGFDKQDKRLVSDIYLYQCETEEWVKVGEMITARWDCTSATITSKELLVVGGKMYNNHVRLDIAAIETVASV